MELFENHKAGFVNIVGNPNVGKSTLMNALVGERLSIITSKSQTTRHRIMGIVNTDEYQLVFSDTPGVIKPNYKLQTSMLNFSMSALADADVLLYVTDVFETKEKNDDFIEKVKSRNIPTILVINKIDLSDQEALVKLVEQWEVILPEAEIFPMSALSNFNVSNVLRRILELVPVSPPYFDKEALTDKPQRFFVSEIIREKILIHYKKEIPYAVEVEIEEYIEEAKLTRIRAVIHVERPSQRAIILGHKGLSIKRVGTEARRDIEQFIGKKVFLEMFVKVTKDWRSKDNQLKNFGYEQ